MQKWHVDLRSKKNIFKFILISKTVVYWKFWRNTYETCAICWVKVKWTIEVRDKRNSIDITMFIRVKFTTWYICMYILFTIELQYKYHNPSLLSFHFDAQTNFQSLVTSPCHPPAGDRPLNIGPNCHQNLENSRIAGEVVWIPFRTFYSRRCYRGLESATKLL